MTLPFRALAVDDSVVCEAELLDHAIAGATAYFIATHLETRVLDPQDVEHFHIGIRPPTGVAPEPQTPPPGVTVEHPAEEVRA